MHILNINQADSGIELWLIQARNVSPIFRYIHKVTYIKAYLLIFGHISADSSIFRMLALPAQIMLTNTCSSSQVLLLTVQIYLKHFFIFVSKADVQHFFLQNSISIITIALIVTCHPCKHAIHLSHATHAGAPHALARHSRQPRQQTTHESALTMPPTLARCTHKHVTHATHAGTNSTSFLKLCLYKGAF